MKPHQQTSHITRTVHALRALSGLDIKSEQSVVDWLGRQTYVDPRITEAIRQRWRRNTRISKALAKTQK